jgi:pheromone shutdown protein TraB
MGHGQVWAVDHPADMDFDGVIKAAEKYGQKGYMEQAMAQGQAYMADLTRRIATDPLSEVLRHMNDPQDLDKNHGLYLLMAQIGTAEDPKGAEVLNGWYRRNLMIYMNLVRLVESPGERVVLVIGAGHAKLLRDYLGSSPNLRLEDTLSYLPAR